MIKNPVITAHILNKDNGYYFGHRLQSDVPVPDEYIGTNQGRVGVQGSFMNTLCFNGHHFSNGLVYTGRELLKIKTFKVVPVIVGDLSPRSLKILKGFNKGVFSKERAKFGHIERRYNRTTGGLMLELQEVTC